MTDTNTVRRLAAHTLRPRLVITASAALLAFVTLAALLTLHIGGDVTARRIDDLGQFGAAVAGAAGGLLAARRTTGRTHLSWLAIGCGTAAWAAGQGVWSYYELIAHRDAPFPSFADVGYLLFPIGATVGLWLFPSADNISTRKRSLLDGGIIVAALFTVSWSSTLGAVADAGGPSLLAVSVSLAYPIGDVLVLSMALLTLCRTCVFHLQLVVLSAAMGSMAIADSSFTYLVALGRYSTGDLCDLGWIAAFLLLAVAAASTGRPVAVERPARRDASVGTEAPIGASMLPYVPLAVAGTVLLTAQVRGHVIDSVEIRSMTVALILLLTRQYLMVRENRGLFEAIAANETQLRKQAFYDPLTGLANRALFMNRAEHALERHRRDLRPVAVLFCDLDDFKLVNDTLGHGVGDELLVQVAQRLRHALRPADTLARLGGDEFAVLLEGGDDPATIGGRLLDALREPLSVGTAELAVRVSVGFTQLRPADITLSVDELLARADIAMYSVKRMGKGRLASYDAAIGASHADDLSLRQPLLDAIATGTITAAFQPIVHLETGEMVGAEALARWTHNTLVVAPDRFVALAARAGALRPLTDHMLDVACGHLAAWSQLAGHQKLHVGVNVPVSLITDRDLPRRVASVIERHRLRPAQLILEVTEDALLEDLDTARAVTRELREIGIQLSLDDFGTGFSSLLHVQQIPLSTLKIDRGFVAQIDVDPDAERLITGILALATSLDLNVVAEGIERQEQADVLRRLGCGFGQGFHYARPLTVDDMGALVRERVSVAATGNELVGAEVGGS